MAVPGPGRGRCPGGLELGRSCSSGDGDRAEDGAPALSPGREGSSRAGWSQYTGVRPGGSGRQHSQTGLPARRCLASEPHFLHLPPNGVSGEHAPSTLRAEDAPGLPLQPRPARPRPEAPGWGRLGRLPPSVKEREGVSATLGGSTPRWQNRTRFRPKAQSLAPGTFVPAWGACQGRTPGSKPPRRKQTQRTEPSRGHRSRPGCSRRQGRLKPPAGPALHSRGSPWGHRGVLSPQPPPANPAARGGPSAFPFQSRGERYAEGLGSRL